MPTSCSIFFPGGIPGFLSFLPFVLFLLVFSFKIFALSRTLSSRSSAGPFSSLHRLLCMGSSFLLELPAFSLDSPLYLPFGAALFPDLPLFSLILTCSPGKPLLEPLSFLFWVRTPRLFFWVLPFLRGCPLFFCVPSCTYLDHLRGLF